MSFSTAPAQLITYRHFLQWRTEHETGHVELVPSGSPHARPPALVTLREVTIPADSTITYLQLDKEEF